MERRLASLFLFLVFNIYSGVECCCGVILFVYPHWANWKISVSTKWKAEKII
jgi:hypothetical protein